MIKNIEQYVLQTLEENPKSRCDDFILYGGVLKRMAVDIYMPLGVFLAEAKKNKMPSFETVSRARRLVQTFRKDLVDDDAKKVREQQEKEIRDYSKSR